MQDHPHVSVPEDMDHVHSRDDVDELKDLISLDHLLAMWVRRPGPADI